MSDIEPALEAANKAAQAVTGSDKPDHIRVVQRQDRLSVWVKGLSGPAVGGMLIATVLLTADWIPFFGKQDIWTDLTEETRAKGVALVAVILAACVSVVLWVAHVGRPSRTEINAGPASIRIEQGEDE